MVTCRVVLVRCPGGWNRLFMRVPHLEPYGFDTIWYHIVYHMVEKTVFRVFLRQKPYGRRTIWYHMVSKPYGSPSGTIWAPSHHMVCLPYGTIWCQNHMVLLRVPSGPHRIIWYVYHMVSYGVATIWSSFPYHMVPYGVFTIWFLPKKHPKHGLYHMIRRANNPYGAWANDCRVRSYGGCHA